jgi:hypothetical protein
MTSKPAELIGSVGAGYCSDLASSIPIGISKPTSTNLVEELEFKPDCSSDEAQEFLLTHECVAVIPSLVDNSPCVIYESLGLGLPFIAAGTGGIPELKEETDRSRLLFEPTVSALAAKIREVLDSDEWAPSRPRFESTKVADLWLSWFERVARSRSNHSMKGLVNLSGPSVTVAVTHYERPKLLDQNLRAHTRVFQSKVDRSLSVLVQSPSSTQCANMAFEMFPRAL